MIAGPGQNGIATGRGSPLRCPAAVANPLAAGRRNGGSSAGARARVDELVEVVPVLEVLDEARAGRFAGLDVADLSETDIQKCSKWGFIKLWLSIFLVGRRARSAVLGLAYQGA